MNICRAQDGFVKLHLKITDSDIWYDNNALVVFTRMLLMAHFKDDFASIRFGGKQYKLKAGEFSATMEELAPYMNMSISTLRGVIKRLEEDKRIDKRTDRQKTIFSICNWSKYQGDKRGSKTNDLANDTSNDLANDLANVTEDQKRIKKVKRIKNIDTNVSILITEKPVDDMFKLWNSMASKKLKPTAASKRACSKLLKEYGEEAVIRAVHGAIFYQQKDYRPQVLSFTSMVTKWDSLNHWMVKDKSKANLKVGFVS